jgi:hypothetical protein
MTIPRAFFLMVLLGSVSVAVIGLRTEQIRLASGIERMQRERSDLRRESWSLQMETARLRSPDQVRDRVVRWSLEVSRPEVVGDVLNKAQFASVD